MNASCIAIETNPLLILYKGTEIVERTHISFITQVNDSYLQK